MELKKTEKYNMQHKLAIVIPAYKAKYLSETLDSIASQTDKRFCVYIGDDCSPEKIDNIVSQYKDKFNYVYQHFDTNLGGKDLVAQWERCIAMTQGEEWIWLFSDDDMMQPNCVETFFNEVENKPHYDLYRFNVNIINKENQTISQCLATNKVMSSEDIYFAKQKGLMNSFVVEYIFSRNVYKRCKGFQSFDLAWNSDIATWMKFGRDNGIKTVLGSSISWRSSGENITTKVDKTLGNRKFRADMQFLKWVDTTFSDGEIRRFNMILRFKLIIIKYFGPLVRFVVSK